MSGRAVPASEYRGVLVFDQRSVSCLLVYPCTDPCPSLNSAMPCCPQHEVPASPSCDSGGHTARGLRGDAELAAKMETHISICMPLTSVILKNPVPIRVQGGPMQQDGGVGEREGGAGGWALKGAAILY